MPIYYTILYDVHIINYTKRYAYNKIIYNLIQYANTMVLYLTYNSSNTISYVYYALMYDNDVKSKLLVTYKHHMSRHVLAHTPAEAARPTVKSRACKSS